jgi:Spy/CpxP family protein refolding chaperone
MQKIKMLVDNATAQIRAMLTPDQQKILDETQHERRGGLKNHGGQTEQSDQEEPGDE